MTIFTAIRLIASSLVRMTALAEAQEVRTRERYEYEVRQRAADERRAEEISVTQRAVAQAQAELVNTQAMIRAEHEAYYQEARTHMKECAKRYEALRLGEDVGDAPIKH